MPPARVASRWLGKLGVCRESALWMHCGGNGRPGTPGLCPYQTPGWASAMRSLLASDLPAPSMPCRPTGPVSTDTQSWSLPKAPFCSYQAFNPQLCASAQEHHTAWHASHGRSVPRRCAMNSALPQVFHACCGPGHPAAVMTAALHRLLLERPCLSNNPAPPQRRQKKDSCKLAA